MLRVFAERTTAFNGSSSPPDCTRWSSRYPSRPPRRFPSCGANFRVLGSRCETSLDQSRARRCALLGELRSLLRMHSSILMRFRCEFSSVFSHTKRRSPGACSHCGSATRTERSLGQATLRRGGGDGSASLIYAHRFSAAGVPIANTSPTSATCCGESDSSLPQRCTCCGVAVRAWTNRPHAADLIGIATAETARAAQRSRGRCGEPPGRTWNRFRLLARHSLPERCEY